MTQQSNFKSQFFSLNNSFEPKNFIWDKRHEFNDLNTTEGPNGRFYETPIGSFPSVTTVLSIIPKPELEAWKQAVGQQAAEQTAKVATAYGQDLHDYIELYLNNKSFTIENQLTLRAFNSIRKQLDQYIDCVIATEIPVYSKFLQSAGRIDCVAIFDGKISIVDFKTSKHPKNEQEIEHYFMQCSAYAVMFEELTGIAINNIVILMAVELSNVSVFRSTRDKHIWNFVELSKLYHNK